jgi:hypothetical protein
MRDDRVLVIELTDNGGRDRSYMSKSKFHQMLEKQIGF